MSRLLMKSFCRAQAARGPHGRPLSTSISLNNNAYNLEHNDSKRTEPSLSYKVFLLDRLRDGRHDLLKSHGVLPHDPILLVKEPAHATERGPPDTKPADYTSDKVLSSRDVVDKENKASLDQLTEVADHLTRLLPRFFSSPHPFNLYTKDVVFIDRTRALKTQGIVPYTMQISMAKTYYSLKYTSNKLELLNLVKDPQESCIKIRWRIVSKPGLIQFMLTFYKYHSTEIWRDAISTMYVNKEGKIYCHICDNIDVEKDNASVKKVVKNPLVDRGVHV